MDYPAFGALYILAPHTKTRFARGSPSATSESCSTSRSRRWTAENPCAFIEKPSELDREVSALTPEEASK